MKPAFILFFVICTNTFASAQEVTYKTQGELVLSMFRYPHSTLDSGGGKRKLPGGKKDKLGCTITNLEFSSLQLLAFVYGHPQYYEFISGTLLTEQEYFSLPECDTDPFTPDKYVLKDIFFADETKKNFLKAYSASIYCFRYKLVAYPKSDSLRWKHGGDYTETYYAPGATAYEALVGVKDPDASTEKFPYWNRTGIAHPDSLIPEQEIKIFVFTNVKRKPVSIRTDIPFTLPIASIRVLGVERELFKFLWPDKKDVFAQLAPSMVPPRVASDSIVEIRLTPTYKSGDILVTSASTATIYTDKPITIYVEDNQRLDGDIVEVQIVSPGLNTITEVIEIGAPVSYEVNPGDEVILTAISEGGMKWCTPAIRFGGKVFPLQAEKGGTMKVTINLPE